MKEGVPDGLIMCRDSGCTEIEFYYGHLYEGVCMKLQEMVVGEQILRGLFYNEKNIVICPVYIDASFMLKYSVCSQCGCGILDRRF